MSGRDVRSGVSRMEALRAVSDRMDVAVVASMSRLFSGVGGDDDCDIWPRRMDVNGTLNRSMAKLVLCEVLKSIRTDEPHLVLLSKLKDTSDCVCPLNVFGGWFQAQATTTIQNDLYKLRCHDVTQLPPGTLSLMQNRICSGRRIQAHSV